MPSRIDQRRQVQRRQVRPVQKWFRRLSVLLLLIIIIIGVASGFFFLTTSAPPTNQNILFIQSNLDDNNKVILLAHISPSPAKVSLITFAADMPVQVLGDYGSYPLRSIAPLLLLDQKSAAFVRAAYSFALGLPIDAVVMTPQPLSADPTHLQSLWWSLLTYRFQSSLSLPQRLALFRFTQGKEVEVVNNSLLSQEAEWRMVREKFHFPVIPANCAVAVVNTTTVSGVGLRVVEVLENSDVPVVRLTDTADQLPTSRMIIHQAEPYCQEVVSHLAALFPFPITPVVDEQVMNQYRANIVVLTGQDFAEQFRKKTGK